MDRDAIRDRIRFTRETINTQGWVMLLEDWKNDIESLEKDSVFNVKTMEALAFNRGALSVLNRIVNLDKLVDAAEASLDAPEAEAEE